MVVELYGRHASADGVGVMVMVMVIEQRGSNVGAKTASSTKIASLTFLIRPLLFNGVVYLTALLAKILGRQASGLTTRILPSAREGFYLDCTPSQLPSLSSRR